MAHMTPKRI